MAEETEGRGAGGEAAAVALGATGTLDPIAADYLRKQGHLAALQAENIAREETLRFWSLRLKLALEFSVALLALALVAGLSVMVWNAAHSEGYVIESFAVPAHYGDGILPGVPAVMPEVLKTMPKFDGH